MHQGHLRAAIYASELLSQPVHLLLAPRPRLRQACIANYNDRWTMLQLACQSNKNLIPFDFEGNTEGPTRTIETLERLRESIEDNFVWLIGSDLLAKVHLWYRAEELPNWVSFLVLKRPYHPNVHPSINFQLVEEVHELSERPGRFYIAPRPMLNLSATSVRKRLAQGKDIKKLVIPAVYDYIISKHVYERKDSY